MRFVFVPLLILALPATAFESRSDLDALYTSITRASLDSLEKRRDAIIGELEHLARLSMNSGVGRIGFRSQSHDRDDVEEWVEINLGSTFRIDSIALVPVLWRDAERGLIADAFPTAFEVLLGVDKGGDGVSVARFKDTRGLIPRVAPLVIDCGGIAASWIRIRADRLSARQFDGRFILQFSEVFAFTGPDNVAMGKAIRTSSSNFAGSGAWKASFVVDGITPYLMDSADGNGTLSFTSGVDDDANSFFQIDLESPQVVEELVLHAVEQTDTVPQAFPGDYGVPLEFVLEGAFQEDFSDAVELLHFQRDSLFSVAPIMSFKLKRAEARFFRITALKPYFFEGIGEDGLPLTGNRFGFSEIELYAGGVNLAEGKPVTSNFDLRETVRKIETLTDGKNLYGPILPVREWVIQLARRHDLEVELPMIIGELENRYGVQKANLYRLKLFLLLLVLAVIVLVFVGKFRQQRAIYHTRERISADLHDVLGGNISAIAILGQLAQGGHRAEGDEDRIPGILNRIVTLADRTRKALKYISNTLSQPGLYENLLPEMRRVSKGLTDGLDHKFDCSGEDYITMIDQKSRIDIFMFYKECLINVIRHSQATRIVTCLNIDSQKLQLEVSDNGVGLPDNGQVKVPASLRRRARILGARVTASSDRSGGSRIRLVFRWNKPWALRLISRIPGRRYRG
jgi:signal transduction histidine kinase